MAAPDVSAVVRLVNKACDLKHAGHHARALEYEERALAAAQALAAQDCLIVASQQVTVTKMTFQAAAEQVLQRGIALPQKIPAPFFAAVTTLQRRRAAGTLVGPGSCRPAEAAFDGSTSNHFVATTQYGSVESPAALADLFGYKLFLEAASLVPSFLRCHAVGMLPMPPEQQRLCVELVAEAAQLFMQPRAQETVAMSIEGGFVNNMRSIVQGPARMITPPAGLLDSLDRLERSGVLQRRRAEVAIQSNAEFCQASQSAVAAAAAAPGLRCCGLTSCAAREKHPTHFKSCGACRGVAYCCKEHQTSDWPAHKAACKAARKAQQAGSSAA